jgi:hypothetical protein
VVGETESYKYQGVTTGRLTACALVRYGYGSVPARILIVGAGQSASFLAMQDQHFGIGMWMPIKSNLPASNGRIAYGT